MPSTAQPTPSSPTASDSSSSNASRESTEQQSSTEQRPGGENTSSEESAKSQSATDDTEPYEEEEPGMPGGGDVLSEEEAIAVLDEQFDESMAVFDGMIVNERAAAQAIERNGSVFSDTQGDHGTSTASNGGNVPSNQSVARAPADIPDGSDDDIVARQIREAALKEQDPVLREKLWEEYRKYKKGQ